MWALTVYLAGLFCISTSELVAPGLERTVNEGVTSKGFNLIYGDEDLTVFNDLTGVDKSSTLKSKVNLNEALPPLPTEDVKCLMSVDRYCSTNMGKVKSVLIQALKDDCKSCTEKQKEEAGKVAASMMAHDPVAWKMFLTRSALQIAPPKEMPKPKELQYMTIGEPETVVRSKNRYIKDGFQVRVKRYAAKIL